MRLESAANSTQRSGNALHASWWGLQSSWLVEVYVSQNITNRVDTNICRRWDWSSFWGLLLSQLLRHVPRHASYSSTAWLWLWQFLAYTIYRQTCISCRYMKVLYKNWSRHISSWSPTLSPFFLSWRPLPCLLGSGAFRIIKVHVPNPDKFRI